MITQLKAQPSVLQYSNSIVGEALLLDTWINNVSEALWHNLWTIFYQLLVYPVAAQPQPVIVETEQCAPDWEQHFNNSVHNGRNFLVQTYPIPMDACPGTTTIKQKFWIRNSGGIQLQVHAASNNYTNGAGNRHPSHIQITIHVSRILETYYN